ncbi:hemolysin III family channel protein [Botrytis cinerea]
MAHRRKSPSPGTEGVYSRKPLHDEKSSLLGIPNPFSNRNTPILKQWTELDANCLCEGRIIISSRQDIVNIWSHLIGAALFVALPVYLYKAEIPPRYAVATKEDIVVSYRNEPQPTNGHIWSSAGFPGSYSSDVGATIPLVYYGFYCDTAIHRYSYWALLSLLAVACSVSTFQPHFRDPFLRPVRAATFGSLAVVTMVPVVHGATIYGWRVQNQRMGITWVLITLMLNVLGATAYAIKFPERWFNKSFDLFGASHQLFHMMVVLAALVYSKAILQAFDFAHAYDHTCNR